MTTDVITATATATEADDRPTVDPQVRDGETLIEDELLVEEVSIDGMCGVY